MSSNFSHILSCKNYMPPQDLSRRRVGAKVKPETLFDIVYRSLLPIRYVSIAIYLTNIIEMKIREEIETLDRKSSNWPRRILMSSFNENYIDMCNEIEINQLFNVLININ